MPSQHSTYKNEHTFPISEIKISNDQVKLQLNSYMLVGSGLISQREKSRYPQTDFFYFPNPLYNEIFWSSHSRYRYLIQHFEGIERIRHKKNYHKRTSVLILTWSFKAIMIQDKENIKTLLICIQIMHATNIIARPVTDDPSMPNNLSVQLLRIQIDLQIT